VKNRATIIDELLHRLKWLIFFFPAIPAVAQVSTANVTGIVQDASSASIGDASVKLINVQTGTENDSKTNNDGRFALPGVIPGDYTLQIERGGFATTQLNGIILNVGDTKNLLIRLKVGSVSESVNVDASGLTLNTTDAAVSTLVDRKFVSNIPLNGRSFQDLISMTPGIVTQSPQAATQSSSTQGDFSVNGQRPESNSFFVDGVSANVNSGLTDDHARITATGSSGGSTALGTTQSLVSIDALQEFRVLSSTYSAEYGRTPGGQFTFLTRSGTNVIHGSLYTYWRGSIFDAADWFSSGIEPTPGRYPTYFSQNDFGGTFGTPIVLPGAYDGHDKTFLFLSHEGLLLTQPTPPTFHFVPSYAVLKDVQAAGPSFLDYFPLPSSQVEIKDAAGNPTGLSSLNWAAYSLPARVNSTSARLDHNVSSKLATFLRYGDTPSYSKTMQLTSLTTNHVRTQTFTMGATTQLATTISDDFRLGFARSNSSVDTVTTSHAFFPYFPATTFNELIGIPSSYSPARADAYIHIAGAGDSEINTDSANSFLHQWNVRNTFNLQVANHLFKFGIDLRHITSTLNPAPLSVEADFFDRQSMVQKVASDIVITKSEPAMPILNEFSAFAQDEWRVSKALTLSFGLRWEVNPPPTGKQGKDAYTAVGDINSPATLRLAPRGTPLWHTGWYNLAPRFGAAWMVRDEPGREMIVRAGGGVFFDTGNQPALSAFNAMGFRTTAYFSNAPVPVTPSKLDFSIVPAPPYTNSTAFAFPSHLQLPYSIQWNIGIEKALGRNQALTISYVGAHGDRLLQEQRRNVSQLNPNFGDVSFFPAGVTSNYQALQTKFQRSISPGVQALASYTWAHSLDYGSTDILYPLTYGNSDLDVRHNLEGAISWDLPKPRKNLLLKYVLGSWGLDGRLIARTAFPVSLLGNLLSDPATGDRHYNGVNLMQNRPLYLYGAEYPGGRIFNGGPGAANPAFSLPDGTAQGNAPRNFVRGFDAVQANVALRREMPIYDRIAVQLQAESFNVLNHPNFGYIDPSLSDALFGRSTKMLNQSFGATGSLYQQGGPRSVQFSLKFLF
jgi:Carboxypeptidase regulatory-like domain/TonB-dependent Receptor Plug Domain